jgi:sugar lactone lactonase YvrE
MSTIAVLALASWWAAMMAGSGSIETIAGDGQAGYDGDGGPAAKARLNQPFHCAYVEKPGRDPVLYIVEQLNHCVRKINLKTGTIMTVAGTGKPGYSGDGGPATLATLNDPHAIDIDPDENIYIADRLTFTIRKVDGKSGVMTTVAGNGKRGSSGDGGPATQAMLHEPDDCCLDVKGGLLIADVADWRIRRVDLKSGIISTFAGVGKPTGKVDKSQIGDGGPATKAVLVGARAVCVDEHGNTYVCEREGNAIRKIDTHGVITTLAGTGARGYTGDGGDAKKATFNGPKAIRWSPRGLLICDTENHAIRLIDPRTNIITTIAGGKKGPTGDGGPATQASLDRPHGAIFDRAGNLYITDSGNNRVRRVPAEK